MLVEYFRLLDVRIDVVVREVLRQNELREDVGVQVGGRLIAQELFTQRLVAHAHPADAHAGSDDLGERAEHAALLAQLLAEAVGRGAGKTQLAVRVILQHDDVRALEDLHDAVVHFLTVAQAGGILEVRDHVGKLHVRVGLHGRRQLVAVDAVGVDGDRQDLRIKEVERLQRDEIGRVLDDHLIAGVEHARADHRQHLLRAVGDDDVVGRHAVDAHRFIALCDPLAQRQIALRAAVLQRHDAVFLKNFVRCLVHRLDRERDRVRQTARKRNQVGRCRCRKNACRKLALKVGTQDFGGKSGIHNDFSFHGHL